MDIVKKDEFRLWISIFLDVSSAYFYRKYGYGHVFDSLARVFAY